MIAGNFSSHIFGGVVRIECLSLFRISFCLSAGESIAETSRPVKACGPPGRGYRNGPAGMPMPSKGARRPMRRHAGPSTRAQASCGCSRQASWYRGIGSRGTGRAMPAWETRQGMARVPVDASAAKPENSRPGPRHSSNRFCSALLYRACRSTSFMVMRGIRLRLLLSIKSLILTRRAKGLARTRSR